MITFCSVCSHQESSHLHSGVCGLCSDNHIFFAGAKRSEVKPRYVDIPHEALRQLAEVFSHGAEVYGIDNWKNNLNRDDVLDHAFEHLEKLIHGDQGECRNCNHEHFGFDCNADLNSDKPTASFPPQATVVLGSAGIVTITSGFSGPGIKLCNCTSFLPEYHAAKVMWGMCVAIWAEENDGN